MFFAGYMIRFKIDEAKVIPQYIFAYTQTEFYKKWTKAIQRTTGQPNINAEEYRSLEIPLPDKKTQEKVIDIYFDFISKKQKNDAEAEKLLSSIDDYLLNELGIILPKETYYLQDDDLKNIVSKPEEKYGNHRFAKEKYILDEKNKLLQRKKIFISLLNEITAKRFDPFFHQEKFKNNLNAISNGKYPVMPLREIISGNLIKGSLPKQDEKEGEISVVQINSINTDGTIALDDLLTAKNIFSEEQKLNLDDVLVVITGATIGKIAYWNYDGEYYLGGDIVKFQTNSLVDNAFVFYFLRSNLMQTEIKRNITGATNGHLSPDDVSHFKIPIPPFDKQKEIANHITDIRQQAQQLKDKTKELLKKASAEIERILLT